VVVEKDPSGLSTVRLWGRLPPGWLGALSLGLARAGVGVVRGRAQRTARGRWEAELMVKAEGELDPAALDYLGLALGVERMGTPVPIAIQEFSTWRDPARGALWLDLRGPDRVGFLGSLLDRLAGLALFPEEMLIETRGPIAVDRLALKSLGGLPPSAEVQAALGALLGDLRPAAT
jgi:hypothetical protein